MMDTKRDFHKNEFPCWLEGSSHRLIISRPRWRPCFPKFTTRFVLELLVLSPTRFPTISPTVLDCCQRADAVHDWPKTMWMVILTYQKPRQGSLRPRKVRVVPLNTTLLA